MADRRSKHQKLRDLINHPRTGAGERAAARAALERLGPERPPKQPPRAPRTGSNPYMNPDWFARFVFSQADRPHASFEDALLEELRRQQQMDPPSCPGCGHAEKFHVSFRCYHCAVPKGLTLNNEAELDEFVQNVRAKTCGWIWTMMRPSRTYRWVKVGGEPVGI